MSLERIAYLVDLGITEYQETLELQERLVELRKQDKVPDVILVAQHKPIVSFGSKEGDNTFSEDFLNEVREQKGAQFTEEEVIDVLNSKGVGFSRSTRGGGATVFSPGQFLYYPIVNHAQITGSKLDVSTYKRKIYGIMFNTLRSLGIEGVNTSADETYSTRGDRRDVWLSRDGISHKMGSKGVRFTGTVAYQGFSLYVDRSGTSLFRLIKPCGYDPSEVTVTSIEEVLGRKIEPEKVHDTVRKNLQTSFDYSTIINLGKKSVPALLDEELGVVQYA